MFVLEVEGIDLMTHFYYNSFTSVIVKAGSTYTYSNLRGVRQKGRHSQCISAFLSPVCRPSEVFPLLLDSLFFPTTLQNMICIIVN